MSLESIKISVCVSRERADNRSLLEYANQNRNKEFFSDVNIKVANECFSASRDGSFLFYASVWAIVSSTDERTIQANHGSETSRLKFKRY